MLISRLQFIGCGGNRGESIDQLSIEDTNFLGYEDSNTALHLIRSTAIIERCTFTSNVVGSLKTIILTNTWSHNLHKNVHADGAVAIVDSSVVLRESIFKKNSAEVGGAIFCERNSNITVINSSFIRNHATSISNNMTNCYGGALYCQSGCIVTVINATFKNNAAFQSKKFSTKNSRDYVNAGGAIVATDEAKVSIQQSIFSENVAAGGGGAIFACRESIVNNYIQK